MAKTRVLVTGLSGVVGQAMQAELADRYELSSLSRYGTEGLDDAHNFRGNITDPDALQAAFRDQEVVVHLAADRSMKAPFESTVDYNITGLYNVYEAARRCGVRRIVFGSSQHTVGGFYRDPPYCHIFAGEFERVQRPYPLLDETAPIRPSGYYGMSKAYGEAMGHYYYDIYGISTIAIRIGFTLSNNVPTFDGSALSLWLSHRDTAQIHVRAIDAPPEVGFTVVFATSDNYWKIFSLEKARAVLGYEPQDDAGPTLDAGAEQLERDLTEFKVHPE
jgi:NAD+ dependent glucose-6-phosphate dehydrogenase